MGGHLTIFNHSDQGRRAQPQRAVLVLTALLALMLGGWWGLPLTGASGGPAAVCQVATSTAAAGTRFQRSYGLAGSSETIRTVLPTSDGGFLLVGQVGEVYQTSSLYPYVVKVDAAGNVQWSRTYGDGNQWTGSAVAAADGRFWLVSSLISSTDRDIYLVKMDADGNVQRAITYDIGAIEGASTILATSDGGFLLVGSTSPGYPSPSQPLVVKLDGSGSVQWSRTYMLSSSTAQTFLFSVVQTADGGFLVGGDRSFYDYRTGQTTYSIVLLKLNPDGTVQQGWELTGGDPTLGGMVTTADGGVLLVGTTVVGVNSQNLKDDDILTVKLDSAGNVQWSRTYGRPGVLDEGGTAVVRTPDGGFLLAGNTHNSSSGFDAYAVKIDGAGNVQWSRTYGRPGVLDEGGTAVVRTPDGGFLLAGNTHNSSSGFDAYAVKIDGAGNVQWSRTYDGGGGEGITTAVMAVDGGFLLAGDTWPDPTAYDDMYVVRTDAVGESDCNAVPVVTGTTTPTIAVSTFVPDSSPVSLTAGTLAFPSTVPATHSESRCRYRLYLPLVVREP
ncbi:MAG: hypothetical protein ACP5UR_17040 [Chloroflexus sp.]|uniref:hypothetical protein n=1 Tax=Chloroflexus sp. TaxID=1904827 RepID=UPI003D117D1E